MAIARDCKSLAFGLQRFESSLSHKKLFEIMEKVVRFFKQDNKWYADVPNHTLEENEMVMGADIALEYLAEGRTELFITLTDEYPGWNAPLVLTRKEYDETGAYYDLSGILFMDFMITYGKEFIGIKPQVWICNVTLDVFGEFPECIYITKITG